MMMLPTGQLIVPASCPGFVLVKYIDNHMNQAYERLKAAEKSSVEEESLTIRCINELGLIQLDRDSSLDEVMVDCCQRLLGSAPMLRHLTHGNHLMITRYYSVLSDGVICIPWNWKGVLDDEETL